MQAVATCARGQIHRSVYRTWPKCLYQPYTLSHSQTPSSSVCRSQRAQEQVLQIVRPLGASWVVKVVVNEDILGVEAAVLPPLHTDAKLQ